MYYYFYKKFKVEYEIAFNSKLKLFEAHASVTCLVKKNNPSFVHDFSTESFTREEAEIEIKKLIKDYIDFEWGQINRKKS